MAKCKHGARRNHRCGGDADKANMFAANVVLCLYVPRQKECDGHEQGNRMWKECSSKENALTPAAAAVGQYARH